MTHGTTINYEKLKAEENHKSYFWAKEAQQTPSQPLLGNGGGMWGGCRCWGLAFILHFSCLLTVPD